MASGQERSSLLRFGSTEEVHVSPPAGSPPLRPRPRTSDGAPGQAGDQMDASLTLPRGDPKKLQTWMDSMTDAKMRAQFIRLLSKTLIFAETSEQFRSAIVDAVVPVEFSPGSVIFSHGDAGSWMGILFMGRLERKLVRTHTEILIGDVGPGAIIGDLGLFGISPRRSFTVTALTSSVVLVLSREKFEEAINKGGAPFSLGLFRDGSKMANLMADTESFLNLACFKGMQSEFIMALRENSEPRLCYQNQVLMKEGHYGDEMFILRAGTVKIWKNSKFVIELPAGVVLGELAVLGADKRRTATVTCSSLCLIRALHSDVFHEILDRFPQAKRVFDHAYVAKLASLDVGNAREEMARSARLNGAPTPKSGEEMRKLFGTHLSFKEKVCRLEQKGTMASLPPLTPRGGPQRQKTASQRHAYLGKGMTKALRDLEDQKDLEAEEEAEKAALRHPYRPKGLTAQMEEIEARS